MRKRRLLPIPLILAVAFALFQYFSAEKVTNPETGRTARVGLSSSQEETLGLQSYQEVLATSETVTHGPEYELVREVARRLVQISGREVNFDWDVTLVRSEQANAFCLPGGKIVIYTGILRHTQNPAGLAAVMGHEMAHAIARHGSQRMLQTTLAQTVMMGAQLSFTDMDPGQRRMVLAALGAGAHFGVLLPFSRDHETEADAMGLLYMARAGYDPREAIRFWERMSQGETRSAPEFASTHPSPSTRIERLREMLDGALKEYTPPPI